MTDRLEPDASHTYGYYKDQGSTNSIDIAIVDLSSDRWPNAGTRVFEGLRDGMQILVDACSPLRGYSLTRHDGRGVFRDRNSWSDLDEALVSRGFEAPMHYHVVYDGALFPSIVGSYHNTATDDGTMWHDSDHRAISGLSLATTRLTLSNVYTRGLHQALHNYISEDIARGYADSDDGYTAIHELGTARDGARTVMADTYPRRLYRGTCSDPDCVFFCRPGKGALSFSPCTVTAIAESIRANRS